MRELRLFGPAGLFLAACVLMFGVHLQHPIRLDRPLRSMPLQLAGVSGTERDVTPEEQRVAGMSDYVYRVFRRDSAAAFSVYVGYYESQTTGQTIHSPKNCLPGAGFEPLESGVASLDADGIPVTVNRYVLANGPSRVLVYYWYQGRGRVAYSEYRVKWDLLRDAMRYGRTEEALVRIVVPVAAGPKPTDADMRAALSAAEETARGVARDLIPRVDSVLPRWPNRARRA